MKLADRIRIGRKLTGMSQEQLAQELNVRRSTVANWESAGNVTPGADRIGQLASVFNVSFEWLATGRGEMGMPSHIHNTPAVEDLLVLEDAGEIRFLLAWRGASARVRRLAWEIIESRAPAKRRTVRKDERA